MKKIIITLLAIAVVIIGIYFVIKGTPAKAPENKTVVTDNTGGQQATTTDTTQVNSSKTVIGKSVKGNDIVAYHYGTGSDELLFVGGVHGGYEWNTVLVAQELADYLAANPSVIPSNIKVTVIPVLNPDGLNKTVGTTTASFTAADVPANTVSGRFNGNNVDLNRNFDCDWQSSGVWQNTKVSGGKSAFSEPESQAIKNYVAENKPTAVVAWYSAAGGVYASSCHNGVSKETDAITKAYATASGYPGFNSFDFYETTGDMLNWFAKNNVPAISILLTDHTNTEWTKNKAGIDALLKYYSR